MTKTIIEQLKEHGLPETFIDQAVINAALKLFAEKIIKECVSKKEILSTTLKKDEQVMNIFYPDKFERLLKREGIESGKL